MSKRTTTHCERIEMIKCHEQGNSLAQIAQQMGVHRNTVKKWWRAYREEGWEGLVPSPVGRPPSGPLSSFNALVRYVVLRLKREHPGWGPDKLLMTMARRPSLVNKRLPKRSALAAYLKPYRARLCSVRGVVLQRPERPAWPLQLVHDCWEIDFKGAERVGPCGSVAPFLVTEALTSAPLLVQVHPASRQGVTFREVQANLRLAFTRWGLPQAIRMDNDAVFVGSSRREWPGTILLWLVGLGITPLVNDPGKPTQNAHVERQGRTWNQDVARGGQYTTRGAAQAASEQAQRDRLAHLPSRNGACAGQPPLTAHPELTIPRRPFVPDQEAALFDFERVELYLADWVFTRLVNEKGCISVANHSIAVGRTLFRQALEVTYDLEAHAFAIRTHDDMRTVLRHFILDVVSVKYILGLP